MVLVNVVSIIIYWYCIFGLGLKAIETKDDSAIGWLVFLELIVHSVIATYYLGIESGFQYYMYTIIFIPFFVWTYTNFIRLVRIIIVITIAMTLEYWGYTHPPVLMLSYESVFTIDNHGIYLLFLFYLSKYVPKFTF